MSSPLNLFYSYCHADNIQRNELDKHLTMLIRNEVILPWHDGKITAGSNWEENIIKNLNDADIVVFLITTNWLGSDACIKEWDLAKSFSKEQPNKLLIPVIATDCAWVDFDDMKTMLVLPYDGNPVSMWSNSDTAWLDVYKGIKNAIEEQKKNLNYSQPI